MGAYLRLEGGYDLKDLCTEKTDTQFSVESSILRKFPGRLDCKPQQFILSLKHFKPLYNGTTFFFFFFWYLQLMLFLSHSICISLQSQWKQKQRLIKPTQWHYAPSKSSRSSAINYGLLHCMNTVKINEDANTGHWRKKRTHFTLRFCSPVYFLYLWVKVAFHYLWTNTLYYTFSYFTHIHDKIVNSRILTQTS